MRAAWKRAVLSILVTSARLGLAVALVTGVPP
nr:MAG TPA: hypothetical protein [Caudoviricetes sp.]